MNPDIILKKCHTDPNQTTELIDKLNEMVVSGWTEGQIIRLAQMRGSYKRNFDQPIIAASHLSTAEKAQLTFFRWLYRGGRLQS